MHRHCILYLCFFTITIQATSTSPDYNDGTLKAWLRSNSIDSTFSNNANQSPKATFLEKTEKLKKEDNLEAFAYSYLDHFLANPVPERINLLLNIKNRLWRPLKSVDEKLAYVIVMCNAGYYLNQYNQVVNSVSAYEKAWQVYESARLNGFDIVEYCLKPLGNAYTKLGDFTSAEKIVKNYLVKAREAGNHDHFAAALINLSIIYHSTGKHEEAIDLLYNGLASNNIPQGKKGLFYANLAKNHLALEALNKSMDACNKAMVHFRIAPPWNYQVHLASILSTQSAIALKSGNPDKAMEFIKQAVNIADTSQMITIRSRAKYQIQHAGILNEKEQYTAALDVYRSVLHKLVPGSKSNAALPDKHAIYAENTLKEVFDGMAATYTKIDKPSMAIQCYELSFEVENQLRNTYNYRQAKYMQQHENRDRAEKAIKLHLDLYDRNNKQHHLKEAFLIAENTKSLVLKAEQAERQYWHLSENDALKATFDQLNMKHGQLNHAIVQEQLKGNDANLSKIEKLIARQNEVMLSIRQLKTNRFLENSMHHYDQITIDSLQNKLRVQQETLIQYFIGNNALYIFKINGKNISAHRASSAIKGLAYNFISHFTDRHKINNAPDEFAKLAFQLHQELIPEPATDKLIIIPDGILNFLPFEAMLTGKPAKISYDHWPWLLKASKIVYQTSANAYLNQKTNDRSGDEKILGVFPEFKNTPRFLKYSSREAKAIKQYYDGVYLHNHEATKSAYLEKAGAFSIIHLSTHAEAGDRIEPPSISFRDSAMFLTEIYGKAMQNNLMVLSACETGIGKLHKGEAAQSLAIGFIQAGVRSIVFSLWKVNDYATATLMAMFYKHYESGETTGSALRKAKLDYLQDPGISRSHKSPYFWASFVHYGSTSRHSEQGGNIVYIIIALGIILGIFLVYIFTKRKNDQ